ncbi:hypothetical protein AWM68_17395 [Fictibacillus phosphorivorans]|uniref:Uncharacterized protein n=2 Tax=Fictibacillus phosphorivorans TaxID=1221500 RepID=A0A163S1A3_9BACL|nr:hypothetical protein AWM68_17395 [Fictibacillus phosphorivorans]
MYYQNHEVMGTDKPIYKEQPEGFFTHEELLISDEDIKQFEHAAFQQVTINGKPLFQMLFFKKNSAIYHHTKPATVTPIRKDN